MTMERYEKDDWIPLEQVPELDVLQPGDQIYDPLSIDDYPCPQCDGICGVDIKGGPSGIHYWYCDPCQKYWRPGQDILEQMGATKCDGERDYRRMGQKVLGDLDDLLTT